MKNTSSLLTLAALLALIHPVRAQSAAPETPVEIAAARGETVIIKNLRGIICVPNPADAALPVPAGFSGVDVSRTPIMQRPDVNALFAPFLNHPASVPSLGRIEIAVRAWLQVQDEAFVVPYVPEQDITEGVIRVVVSRAKLGGEVAVEGAKWFSADHYRHALAQSAGAVIDSAALGRGVELLNANPFHRVSLVAESGETPGTTRLKLVATEQRPWRVTAGYDNTGTSVTGQERINAGLTWGNAFGRGDQLGYRYNADPAAAHSVSHSVNYATQFSGGRSLAAFGSYSHVDSMLPPPITQEGNSGQAGVRFTMPLRAPREGWKQSLTFAADFKYSDNTLEFAAIPITDNATHILQGGLTYALDANLGAQGRANVSASVFASPGGLSSRNHTRYFAIARRGAKASYAYARIDGGYSRPLFAGLTWMTNLSAQFTGDALLGSEQLNGSGSSAVRGYRESTSFGDWGVVVNNELHAPPVVFAKARTQVDLFGFADFGSLNVNLDSESTDVRSAGLGANLQVLRNLSIRFAYGWQLKHLDRARHENGRGHFAANVNW